MNETITAQTQMQKGFKTFILTLSVSLIIFSVIYYFISDKQSTVNANVVGDNAITESNNNTQAMVQGSSDESTKTPVIEEAKKVEDSNLVAVNTVDASEETVFGKLSATSVKVDSRAVLAGAVTSPTKTGTTGIGTTAPRVVRTSTVAGVPNGGVTQLTWGFFISLISFVMGFVVISKDPRKMAIQHFEKKMLR